MLEDEDDADSALLWIRTVLHMQQLQKVIPSIEASKVIGHERDAEAGTIGVLGRPEIRFVGKRSQILRWDDLLEKPGAPFSTPPLERELQVS